MKKILYSILFASLSFSLTSCNDEDELTPKIDTSMEYEAQLRENASKSETDAKIWEWYQKYGTAFIFEFEDKDFKWNWASTFTNAYTPYDRNSPEDMEQLAQSVKKIEDGFLANYTEDFLKRNLPFRIFLVKTLRSSSSTTSTLSSSWVNCATNKQDAMIIGDSSKTGKFTQANYTTNLATVFLEFFYDKLPVEPTKFIESKTEVKYKLVTTPNDPKIDAEISETENLYADDVEMAHRGWHAANVCGYVKGYGMTGVTAPTDSQDFADFLNFVTERPGSEIRRLAQHYWRLAWRATLFIDYYARYMDEDLIATQNAKFPDDPVKMADFAYVRR